MSWNIDFRAGSKDEAKAELATRGEAAAGHFPDAVKALIEQAIDDLPDCEDSDVSVVTFGHFNASDNRSTSNLSIKVENHFKVAPAAEEIEQPAVAAGNGDPAGEAAQGDAPTE